MIFCGVQHHRTSDFYLSRKAYQMAFYMITENEIPVYALLISLPIFFISLIRLSTAAHVLNSARNKDNSNIEILSKAQRVTGTALPLWHAADHDIIEIYVNEHEKCTFHLQQDDLHPVPGDSVVLYRLPEPLPNPFYIADESRTYMTETSYRFACETEQRNGCCTAEKRKRCKDTLVICAVLAVAATVVFIWSSASVLGQLQSIP